MGADVERVRPGCVWTWTVEQDAHLAGWLPPGLACPAQGSPEHALLGSTPCRRWREPS